jgi:hypothetical protein
MQATAIRVFTVIPSVTVVFCDLTIRGGLARVDGRQGAAPNSTQSIGGGILAFSSNVTLDNVALEQNEAVGGLAGCGYFVAAKTYQNLGELLTAWPAARYILRHRAHY